jgi:hypothetical protein
MYNFDHIKLGYKFTDDMIRITQQDKHDWSQ